MKRRLLAFLLIVLCSGASTCSKSEEPEPKEASQVSYVLNGIKRQGTATANFRLASPAPLSYDILEITIDAEVSSSLQREQLSVVYLRPKDLPGKPYVPNVDSYLNGSIFFFGPGTAAEISTGGYSGTFSGIEYENLGGPVPSGRAITNGVFTDVRE